MNLIDAFVGGLCVLFLVGAFLLAFAFGSNAIERLCADGRAIYVEDVEYRCVRRVEA